MSHITELDADKADQAIKDLHVLKKAAERCGLEFRENQTTFHSWATDHGGQLVGDHPLPEGRTADDVGRCQHAMGIPTAQQGGDLDKYEIGVVESNKYPGTYSLLYDFFGGALERHVGDKCEDLMMFYQMEAARAAAEEQGYTYNEEKLEDGTYTATVEIN
jgi:hypothetical protein